jgi:acetylglutamate kinase
MSSPTVVVKYGGNAMIDPALQRSFAADVCALQAQGFRMIVTHGGGPQISAMLDRLGVKSTFVGGLRATTPEVMDVVAMVLVGQVQRELVGLINVSGSRAVGTSGEDGAMFIAERKTATVDGQQVDIGQVGDVVEVQTELITTLVGAGFIPVVSSVARDRDGVAYNVNADTAAAALAIAVQAEELIILTDVEGVYANWPNRDSLIRVLGSAQLRTMLPSLESGMVPKMEACLRAVDGGVGQARVIDGRVPHALTECFASTQAGTVVVKEVP